MYDLWRMWRHLVSIYTVLQLSCPVRLCRSHLNWVLVNPFFLRFQCLELLAVRNEGLLTNNDSVFGLCFQFNRGMLLASTEKCVYWGTGAFWRHTITTIVLSFTAIALAFAMLSNKTNKYIQFELVLVTEAIGSCLIKQKALCPHSSLNIFCFHFPLCACPFSTCQFRNLSLPVCMLLLARLPCRPAVQVRFTQWCSTQFDANLIYALHAFASTYEQSSLFHSLVTFENGF